jgi:flagellar protein FlaJ
LDELEKNLKNKSKEFLEQIRKISLPKKWNASEEKLDEEELELKDMNRVERKKFERKSELEKKVLKSLRTKNEKREKEELNKKTKSSAKEKPNKFIEISNKFFAEYSRKLLKQGKFNSVERDIIKAKMPFVPTGYISAIFFATILAVFGGILLFVFFLFFNVSSQLPIVTLANEAFSIRFLKVFWLIFLAPISVFAFMYYYPSMEKKSVETKINRELPFATIHMSAISGSMIDPSNIFRIIISTKEYPCLEKEFTRLLNEINIYGYDLVTALRNIAGNSPSRKLAELFTGLATTISSGGDLPNFFDKRSESLLFEYKIDRQKQVKTSETFMDVYISVVIAAPMILMLLLVMIRISGLGFSLSTSAITLITVMGVFLINIVFLGFLHLKQPSE